MNKVTESPASYGILNPSRLARRDADGRIHVTVKNAYGMLGVYQALHAEGLITVHSVEQDAPSRAYGFTNLVYSIV